MTADRSGAQGPGEGQSVAPLDGVLGAPHAGADDVQPEQGADLDDLSAPRVDGTEDGESGAGAGTEVGADPEVELPEGHESTAAGSVRPSKLLYLVMALLVLSVPAFGYVGYSSITNNTRGQVLSGRSTPDSPGYEALVEPTPTALVIQKDSKGAPVSLTLLSLSGPNQAGGAVVGIPLTTRLVKGVYAFHTFGEVLEHGTTEAQAKGIAAQLGIGFSEVVALDDATLATFIKPLGTLQIDNPTDVTARSGETFAKGPLTLAPDQVEAYMGATDAGSSETARLARVQLVWQAWIAAIRGAKRPAVAVPGEVDAGLGRYLRGLAAGKDTEATLPVRPAEALNGVQTFDVDVPLSDLLLTNAVPFPVADAPGDRATTRVLNGAGPGTVPASILQRLTYAKSQINAIGNNDTFGVEKTTVRYSSAADKRFVVRIIAVLGDVKVVHAPSGGDTTALTIVVGKDLIAHPPAPLSPSEVAK